MIKTLIQKTANGTRALLFIAVCGLLVLSGCQNPAESRDTAETGNLSLTVGRQGAERTIMPDTTLNDFTAIYLTFTARTPGNTGFTRNWADNEIAGGSFTGTIGLHVGTWDLHVSAHMADGEAATGSLLDIEVPAGQTVAGTVQLTPFETGQHGSFRWVIGFPANVSRAEIAVRDLAGAAIPGVPATVFNVPAGVGEWADSVRLPTGRHRAVFTLTHNDGRRAVASEVLHIYRNMESVFEGNFEDCHFITPITLAWQLARLRNTAQDGGRYTIELFEDESISPVATVLPAGITDLYITLTGVGGMHSVSLSAGGTLFIIPDGVTLTLDENITLQGRSGNNNPLVRVDSGGTLVMNAGARITGNANTSTVVANLGGGVLVNSGGTFAMRGGEISGNSVGDWNAGGGVHVADNGTFRISDGIIYGREGLVEAGLRNMSAIGAALFSSGTAQYGTFNPVTGEFTQTQPSGTLWSTSNTIYVRNGVLIGRPPSPLDVVRVQGGTFQMGSPTGGEANERPVRSVTVSSFYMGRFQVTQGEWYDVMGTRPSYFNGTNNSSGTTVTPTFQWRNLPVERVSWYDAIVFSNRLSIARGLTPAYSIGGSTNPDDWWGNAVTIVPGSSGYRLPTEAQWECVDKARKTAIMTTKCPASTLGMIS